MRVAPCARCARRLPCAIRSVTSQTRSREAAGWSRRARAARAPAARRAHRRPAHVRPTAPPAAPRPPPPAPCADTTKRIAPDVVPSLCVPLSSLPTNVPAPLGKKNLARAHMRASKSNKRTGSRACVARIDRRVTGEQQVCLRTTRWHAPTSEGESRMARAPP